MDRPEDRRLQPRSAANLRGIVLAPGLELSCLIVDQSSTGVRLRLDRNLALPARVVIVDIAGGSSANMLGFRPGDVILEVNGTRIARTRDLEAVAGKQSRVWEITIQRGGQQLSVTLRG